MVKIQLLLKDKKLLESKTRKLDKDEVKFLKENLSKSTSFLLTKPRHIGKIQITNQLLSQVKKRT